MTHENSSLYPMYAYGRISPQGAYTNTHNSVRRFISNTWGVTTVIISRCDPLSQGLLQCTDQVVICITGHKGHYIIGRQYMS